MKAIHQNTARWAPLVLTELQKQGLPLPVELILAVIDVESRGVTGLVNPKSGASGLMQVMPIALKHYNSTHAVKFTMADLQSKTNPVAQIRVGTWILGQFWRNAHDYLSRRLATISMDELAKIADLMFAAGGAAVRKKLDKLPVPTVEGLKTQFSSWNALPHIENVFNRVSTSSISETAVNNWVTSSAKTSITPGGAGGAGDWIVKALVGIAIGYLVSLIVKTVKGQI